MNKIPKILLFLLISSSFIIAQRASSKSAFVSIYGGDMAIISENFTEVYGSKNDFTLGAELGIPISRSFSFDMSVSYFNKTSDFSELERNLEFETAELKQIMINAGFQFHLLPNKIIGFSLLFGANFALIDEEWQAANGEFFYQVEKNGNFGAYGGANLELNLGRSPLALFSQVKYTYSSDPIMEYIDSYREVKFTGGLKLYLANRWK